MNTAFPIFISKNYAGICFIGANYEVASSHIADIFGGF
jgi:hypothetical protein